MKKLLFIYNPKSGKAQIRNHLFDIIDIFVKADYEVTVYPTQCQGDASRVTREMDEKYDLLVCSGGDGTLDEVVTGMMKSGHRIPIGYIPAGSTNDFANSLHISKSMTEAAADIVRGRTFACDIGDFNDDTFVYIAAFGLFTDVSYETGQQMKNLLGHMAYLMEGMKRLTNIRSYHLHVTNDGLDIEDDFIFGMITNSESVGGFKRITGKYVELDDGLFEVTLIKKPKNPMEWNEIMAALVMQDINTNCMYCFKASEITVESKEEIAWTLDGEYGGSHTKVHISNEKQAMIIKIPPKS
ncbi:MAG: YegS/Rv2252/BmrU family lipid kinase [Clostridiales bacterium]|nr:YegS/Rv2252/BmrU family lipid kinase [Clostridiales bacterium]